MSYFSLLYNQLFAEDHQFTRVEVFFLTCKGGRRKEKVAIASVSATAKKKDFSVSDLFLMQVAKKKFQ